MLNHTKGFTAVVAQRREPPDALDFFPTPLWSSRALFRHVLPFLGIEAIGSVWEPACGEGHMAAVIAEFTDQITASDIFDYGFGKAPHDFLHDSPLTKADWIVSNPPFSIACEFTLRALDLAKEGVAMLVRTQWIEGVGRGTRSCFGTGRLPSMRHSSSAFRWSKAAGTLTHQPQRLTLGLSGTRTRRISSAFSGSRRVAGRR